MCIYNMEQMCTGIYYFLGPVFVMAEEGILSPSSLTPLFILMPAAPQEPLGPVHAVGLGLCASGSCWLPVLGEPGCTHLVLSLGQPSLPESWRLAVAPHSPSAPTISWGICPLT